MDIPEWHVAALQNYIQDNRGPLYIAACHATGLDDIASGIQRRAPEDIARVGFAVASILDNKAPAPENMDEEEKQWAENIAKAGS